MTRRRENFFQSILACISPLQAGWLDHLHDSKGSQLKGCRSWWHADSSCMTSSSGGQIPADSHQKFPLTWVPPGLPWWGSIKSSLGNVHILWGWEFHFEGGRQWWACWSQILQAPRTNAAWNNQLRLVRIGFDRWSARPRQSVWMNQMIHLNGSSRAKRGSNPTQGGGLLNPVTDGSKSCWTWVRRTSTGFGVKSSHAHHPNPRWNAVQKCPKITFVLVEPGVKYLTCWDCVRLTLDQVEVARHQSLLNKNAQLSMFEAQGCSCLWMSICPAS